MRRDQRVRTWPEGTWETLADSSRRLRNGVPSKIAANRLELETAKLRGVVDQARATCRLFAQSRDNNDSAYAAVNALRVALEGVK